MEYTNILHPILLVFISCGIGMVLGSLHMWLITYRDVENLKRELDMKTKLLNSYENQYEDDGYEAY